MNEKEYEEFTKTYQSLYEKAMDVLEARNKIYEEVTGESRDSHKYVDVIEFLPDDEIRLTVRYPWDNEIYDEYLLPEYLYDTENFLTMYKSQLIGHLAVIEEVESIRKKQKQKSDRECQEYLKLKT